jgi:hypothetical protein
MKIVSLLLSSALALCLLPSCSTPGPAPVETVNFDATAPGALPDGWLAGVTGAGTAHWAVTADPSAPSPPNVLKQSAAVPSRSYPWCVKTNVALKDGFVEVKFKPLAGQEDQAGGVVWRWQDGGDYYVARGNALEDNVILFRTVKGVRKQLRRVPVKVSPNQWHTLRVDFKAAHIVVLFDGQEEIEWDDQTFKEAGAVGVWTKADSVTAFDNFRFSGR